MKLISFKLDLNKTTWWKVGGGFNGSNACNKIEGTDGQQFHPDLKEDEKLWIFSTDLCRSMFLTFQVNRRKKIGIVFLLKAMFWKNTSYKYYSNVLNPKKQHIWFVISVIIITEID